MSIYGGAETVVRELSVNLSKLGVRNKVLTLSLTPEVEKICKNVDFILPSKKISYKLRSTSFFNALGIINEIKLLWSLIKKYADDFDIINLHNFPATWSIYGINKPAVWMCNEPPDLWNNPNPSLPLRILRKMGLFFDKFIINKYIDGICVADEFNSRRIVKRYCRSPQIIPYGINYNFFSQGVNKNSEVIRKYKLDGSFILLQVGMLSPQKNQLESIKALSGIKNSIQNIKLILAGMGNNAYEQLLKKYILENKLGEYVIFTGHLSKEDIRALYHTCNVALFPVKSQGGWLSPFEAMCAGKPVIVHSKMGAASLIQKNNLGIVTEDFKDAILEIYRKQSNYYQLAEQARKWVQENLSWEIFTKKMLEVFKKVLEKRRKA